MNHDFDALLRWYETLTPASLDRLGDFYAADAAFKDPFNDVTGLPAIRKVFSHMFAATENPRFFIVDKMRDGNQAFASWRFEFGLNGKKYEIAGVTHFLLNDEGKIASHRDYWDVAEELWQKLPLLGPLVGWLRSRFSAARSNVISEDGHEKPKSRSDRR
jgi:ketosteroid isomerase-like protein